MIGILTEKPSQAANYAEALGGKKFKIDPKNYVYGYKGNYKGDDFVIVNAIGHLYGLSYPHKQVPKDLSTTFEKWQEERPWDLSDFKFKKEIASGKRAAVNAIEKELKHVDEICIATDVDESGEGDLLAWEILLEKNIYAKKYTRSKHVDESKKYIQDAFSKREVIEIPRENNPIYKAANYREKFDFTTMQYSRIVNQVLKDEKGIFAVPRYGRLKSAMVLLVGDQLKAHNEYKKIPAYVNKFSDENGNIYSNPNEEVYKNREDVPKKYEDSNVIVDKKEMKKTSPPKFYDMSSLGSVLTQYKSDDIKNTYQRMYDDKMLSYPRTEDKNITEGQFEELLPVIDKIAKVVGVDPKLLTHRRPRYKTHVENKGSHGANRPGYSNVPSSLDAVESKYGKCGRDIYETLALNYLASLAEDYEYERWTGHLEKYPDFKGSTNIPKKPGWKLVFNDSYNETEDTAGKELGRVASPFIDTEYPPKPSYPTRKWLMNRLEKLNIGTGATRLTTYGEVTKAKSKNNKYPLLADKKGKIYMAEYGDIAYSLLPNTHIGRLDLTTEVFDNMKKIREGKLTADKALFELTRYINEDMVTIKTNAKNINKEITNKMSGQQFEEKEKVEGEFNGEIISFNREWSGHRFTDEEVDKLLNGEEISFEAVSRKGSTYTAYGVLAEQEYNGNTFYGFKPDFDTPRIPKQWAGHTFTKDERKALEAGQKIKITGLVSKKTGKEYDANFTFNKNKGIEMSFD